ncbi:LacI family transcription regulator [Actinoplanes sp. SE50]|uniref:LacI family DNA-binding transcriptional regulator n=1 Tax=unclassified Actinoplanes TaxID=2626549 RepID=UPI00023ED053|nr:MULTISPECIES: LacI family DNA-binding transcriptional regulator [unclassified Actinoplanes]AEV83857.1 LacI family transcription regulator [Actinoplanes sp. SE50/110]ATO81999.1 LacI family transcription regulator [Actinoplanes sp. SE50]SLL99407.1 LacI family transcriptional regulator [Actinoplanes sp. SE50/110]
MSHGLADVARLAGVSPATASRVLSGSGPASADSRAAVRAAAATLGYQPHPVARQLARGTGTRLVFAVRDERADILRDPFVIRAAAAMAAVLDTYDIGLTLRRIGLGAAADLRLMSDDRGLAALVLAGHDRVMLANLPPGLRGRTAAIGTGGADVDSAAGVGALLSRLYAGGRRRIALIAGPAWLAASAAPVAAYAELTRSAGLPARIVRGDFTSDGGRAAARGILDRWPDTDAIAAVSDATALGVLQALAAAGRRVPDDVAVTGFDDVPLAGATHPALSTATHPVEEIAVAAARAALGEPAPATLFPSVPVFRETCGGSASTA